MAETSNKVLYIDNVTTYDYVKTYRENQEISDAKNAKFTYVVFTEYERPNNYGVSYHGDIFFNGSKITYINDVNVNSAVTDGKDTIIGYVNDKGGIDFARSTILLGNFSNSYELFNVADNITSINYQSNLGYFTTEHEGTWDYDIIHDNADLIKVKLDGDDKSISCEGCHGNVEIHLSYTFEINEGNKRITCVDYAYYNIYNLINPTTVTFGDTPTVFTYNSIYTPIMSIAPHEALQTKLTFTTSSSYIEILNERTGTFRCIKPGTGTIQCTYDNGSVEYDITVSKINPMLSITAFGTTYLYDESEYSSTFCYAHYDTKGLDVGDVQWTLNDNPWGNDPIKSNMIEWSDLSQDNINVVKFIMSKDNYVSYSTAKQLYSPSQETLRTQEITIDNYQYSPETNLVSFVIVATANDNGFVDTNYSFENSMGLSNFNVYDITHDGNTTYTYVSATIENSILNDIYAQYAASYNNTHNQTNTPITCYNIINVHTTDASFVSAQKTEEYIINTEMYNEIVGRRTP